jgi:hypothetical protein
VQTHRYADGDEAEDVTVGGLAFGCAPPLEGAPPLDGKPPLVDPLVLLPAVGFGGSGLPLNAATMKLAESRWYDVPALL